MPVLWQIHIFLPACLSDVVVPVEDEDEDEDDDEVEAETAPLSLPLPLPLPGGGPFAIATDAAMPATKKSVISSALNFTVCCLQTSGLGVLKR